MVSFALSDELEAFRSEVRKMTEGNFREKAGYWDTHSEYPAENRQLLADLGYLGILIPEEYGGSGGEIIQGIILLEEIARTCFNTSTICQVALHGPSRAITIIGSEEHKKKYLPKCATGEYSFSIAISEPHAGSAVTELTTSAREDSDHYVINGEKCFCTLAEYCTHVLVFCRFGDTKGVKGIGAIIVDRDTPGFEVGARDIKMGGKGVPESTVYFNECRVPKANILVEGTPDSSRSFKTLMSSFGPERVGNATMCMGLAQAAYEAAVKHGQERIQFGRPIMEFQGIQWKIADMATQVHAARLMVYRAATNLKDGFPDPQDAAMAKLYANEMVQRVTNEALQIHGHPGYTKDYPVEQMVRDCRGYALAGGTTEILRNTIAAQVFGRTFDQRRS